MRQQAGGGTPSCGSHGSSAAAGAAFSCNLDEFDPAGRPGGERVVEVGHEALVGGQVVEQGGPGLAVVDGDAGEVLGQSTVGLHGVGEQAVPGQQPSQSVLGAGGEFRRVGLLAEVVQVLFRLQGAAAVAFVHPAVGERHPGLAPRRAERAGDRAVQADEAGEGRRVAGRLGVAPFLIDLFLKRLLLSRRGRRLRQRRDAALHPQVGPDANGRVFRVRHGFRSGRRSRTARGRP